MQEKREAPLVNNRDSSAEQEASRIQFVDQCREHHLRVTPQRLAIYDELREARNHPSAEQIYRKVKKRLRHISFDTVNRTLLTFAEIHLADMVEGSGEPRRFDPQTRSHHHFICSRCSGITDIQDPVMRDVPVPPEILSTCAVTGKRIIYQGICESCRRSEATPPPQEPIPRKPLAENKP
jgi:Fur family peroxide stress response transcriptional regulator